MNEIEALLARDREAPLPELPDADVTAAMVARRLTTHAPPGDRGDSIPRTEMVLFAGATMTVLSAAGGALLLGVSPWWLLLGPLLLLPLVSILYKGVS